MSYLFLLSCQNLHGQRTFARYWAISSVTYDTLCSHVVQGKLNIYASLIILLYSKSKYRAKHQAIIMNTRFSSETGLNLKNFLLEFL